MHKILLLVLAVMTSTIGRGQNSFKAVIKDSLTQENLFGVTVGIQGTSIGTHSNTLGEIYLTNLPDGPQILEISLLGYGKRKIWYTFPLAEPSNLVIYLSPEVDNLDEVIVEGTRSNKSIANIPTRVEVLTEEIDEASTMDPSKVAHLLTHSTGIQVQQTSATSNTANVRIQGLDGRYTQILKDGFPLYGGFSGSLSIMHIPPLDLRQIEYIKGGASTLYGGGAIAGLINLISKEPTKEETLLHLNASHIGAFDVNVFTSKKMGKMGFTLLAQRNTHRLYDADKDGFTDLPQLAKYNINPKVFFYFSNKTKLSVGATLTSETRQGGDVTLLENELPDSNHFYQEKNEITRTTTQTKLEHGFDENNTLTLRNSLSFFNRSLSITPSYALGEYRFAGKQLSTFSEVAYTHRKNENVLITGLNFYTDRFTEQPLQSIILRNEGYQTLGAFSNYTVDISKKLSIEAGLRVDYVIDQQTYILPRLAALFKWSDRLTTRVGGGLGYRNASIFNEEAELLGYRNVLPINRKTTQAEQSYGGNIDIGYKLPFGEQHFIHVNQMFFYTHLEKPLILSEVSSNSGVYHFNNATGFTQSIGGETFLRVGFYDFVLFVGYTYTQATNHFNGVVSDLTLTPRHSLKGDLLYAIPNQWRIGLDYEYKSSQTLSTGVKTPDFWTYGALVEYTWKNFTFFGNIENYTNVRQTRYESLLSAPYGTPQFTEVWAPLDGLVFNAGLKIKL